jgi:hypothetical protein
MRTQPRGLFGFERGALRIAEATVTMTMQAAEQLGDETLPPSVNSHTRSRYAAMAGKEISCSCCREHPRPPGGDRGIQSPGN